MNRSIIFVSPGVAEVIDKEMPKVEADQVLVKLNRTTISAGTER